jgi:hypothetical protein
MSPIRHEHRSLPVLITLGVLLGAGLALASPVGHRPLRTPTPVVSVSPMPTPSASPTVVSPSAAPVAHGGVAGKACGPVEPIPGWAAGHVPLAHAIHVIAAGCAGDHGKGLQNAIVHLSENAARDDQAHGDPANAGAQGGDKGGHSGDQGGKDASDSGGSGGATGWVDVIHGKGRDGVHGKDAHEPRTGGTVGTDTSNGGSPSARGASSTERGNGGGKRPWRPPVSA